MRNVSRWITCLVVALAACSEGEPSPSLPDTGTPAAADSGASGDALADAGLPDPGDSGTPGADAAPEPDASSGMDGGGPGPDGGQAPDAAPVDGGSLTADLDQDTLTDVQEGAGAVDTDQDGTPDSSDTDTDGDGLLDSMEAGDADPLTPPLDSDRDGTADFRDLDSDGDGIPDQAEGGVDTDGDGIPDFRDLDSDGDGLSDQTQGNGDSDGDGTPDRLDLDDDGDGLLDSVEGTADTDLDGTPDRLDLDSDGDGIGDALEGLADPEGDLLPAFRDLDSDGDSLLDAVEGTADPDQDGRGNWLDEDDDGDTIRDVDEGALDVDQDSQPNYLDLDSDADGLLDQVEAGDTTLATPPLDADFDLLPNAYDLDSDGDTLSDAQEGAGDTDGDLLGDYVDIDADNDSVVDSAEAGDADLSTGPVDSDGDLLPDFRDLDSDGDTILDLAERQVDTDGDGAANRVDPDSDGDGASDAAEAGDGDPATPPRDTDLDGAPDYVDLDSDADGLADAVEPGCPAGSSAVQTDSDADGFLDPAERAYGSDPCSAASVINDFYFVLPPLAPLQSAPLSFTNTALDNADLAINMDTTGSMGGEANNLRNSLSTTIIPGVQTAIPNAAFAVASFEDYPVTPFGAAGDLPWRLGQRVTTNGLAAQGAVNALTIRNGDDIPESGLEALYQVATGLGTQWAGGAVAPFNPSAGLIPGVADGTIGGVGFRTGALPIVVHITDAPSHVRADYLAVSGAIAAADTAQVDAALGAIGARVVTIANQSLPRPDDGAFTALCSGTAPRVLGRIAAPAGSDTDWFQLAGATSGQSVTLEIFAAREGSTLDSAVGLYDNNGTRIAFNDDQATTPDSRLTATLSGAAPYFVAVSSWADFDFNGSGGNTAGFYFLTASVAGTAFTTAVTECRSADDANGRAGATPLVPFATAVPPANQGQCVSDCRAVAGREPLTLPYGMSEQTRAVVPTCAWDQFGASRPAGCAPTQCCTGLNGAGEAPSAAGGCPLSFRIDDSGNGLGNTVVTAIRALVSFSPFTVTTVARPDPVELAATGIDTTCFIHGVIPQSATPPNTCAPQPVPADLLPPVGELDSFEDVTPGTALVFTVNARNLDRATNGACAPALVGVPRLFRATIEVVADGVTVLDTRTVIIIVPPLPPGNNQ